MCLPCPSFVGISVAMCFSLQGIQRQVKQKKKKEKVKQLLNVEVNFTDKDKSTLLGEHSLRDETEAAWLDSAGELSFLLIFFQFLLSWYFSIIFIVASCSCWPHLCNLSSFFEDNVYNHCLVYNLLHFSLIIYDVSCHSFSHSFSPLLHFFNSYLHFYWSFFLILLISSAKIWMPWCLWSKLRMTDVGNQESLKHMMPGAILGGSVAMGRASYSIKTEEAISENLYE